LPAGLEADIVVTATGLMRRENPFPRVECVDDAAGIWLTIIDTAASRPTRLPFPSTGSRCQGARLDRLGDAPAEEEHRRPLSGSAAHRGALPMRYFAYSAAGLNRPSCPNG